MLQLTKLHTKLQLESCMFGKKWIYHVTYPSLTLEMTDYNYHFTFSNGIKLINSLDNTILRVDVIPSSTLISYSNNTEDSRIADLEREVSQLREIVNNITRRDNVNGQSRYCIQ